MLAACDDSGCVYLLNSKDGKLLKKVKSKVENMIMSVVFEIDSLRTNGFLFC